jgi:hypothetical protein
MLITCSRKRGLLKCIDRENQLTCFVSRGLWGVWGTSFGDVIMSVLAKGQARTSNCMYVVSSHATSAIVPAVFVLGMYSVRRPVPLQKNGWQTLVWQDIAELMREIRKHWTELLAVMVYCSWNPCMVKCSLPLACHSVCHLYVSDMLCKVLWVSN